jgi:hypothetical protein
MSNNTSQVQHKRRPAKLSKLDSQAERFLQEGIAALTAKMEARDWAVFDASTETRRHYPGEAEADCVLGHLRILSEVEPNPKKLEALLKQFHILQTYEEAINSGDPRAVARIKRAALVVWKKLDKTVLSGQIAVVDYRKEGIVIEPITLKGRTALALLSLLFRHHRLSRIRRCLHCDSWFFARFKPQQFCRDPKKKCQWNHYHTPEWRRKQREQNKNHQRAYRERIFPKRKHAG